jgi:hypothetical protein
MLSNTGTPGSMHSTSSALQWRQFTMQSAMRQRRRHAHERAPRLVDGCHVEVSKRRDVSCGVALAGVQKLAEKSVIRRFTSLGRVTPN